MRRILAPTARGEAATRGALVVAAVVGVLLAGAVDIGPPDYALPLGWPGDQVTELTGVETEGGSGGQSSTAWQNVRLATGDEIRIELAWSDHELFPPDDHAVLVDRVHRCVRIVVSATGSVLTTDAADALAATQARALDTYLDDAPRDLCLGRPGSV